MASNALQKIYNEFNKRLFGKKLPHVEFVPDPNRKCIFRYFPDKGSISVGRFFSDVNSSELMDELLHEMVHIRNFQLGIEDHTPNQYHKKEFCDLARKVGLCVGHTSNRGWGVTASKIEKDCRKPNSNDVKRREAAYRVAKIHPMTLSKFQREMSDVIASKPVKQYQFKYVCKCNVENGNSVRSGRRPDGSNALKAVCSVCGAKFVFDGDLSKKQ